MIINCVNIVVSHFVCDPMEKKDVISKIIYPSCKYLPCNVCLLKAYIKFSISRLHLNCSIQPTFQ